MDNRAYEKPTESLKSVSKHADSSGRVSHFEKDPAMNVDRKTVSIPRACELVGVSRRTIYNWIASGKIQYVRTAGGSVRIFADTLWRDPNAAEDEADLQRLRPGA